jgi:ABC-type branched-subunit amino acid transport system substrate-binding protein
MKSSEAFGRAKLAQPRTPRARTFDVGLLIPTSGTMGLLGPGAYACARLARDMWNERGGVDGREVRLSVIDSGEAATDAHATLRAMLDSRELDALVVLSNTAVCSQVAEVVDARIPLIYTSLYEGSGLPGWVHAIGETPDRQLLPAIDWMAERYRPRRCYLLGNDYCFPRSTHAIAIPRLRSAGIEIVRERYVPIGEPDYGPVVADIAASGAGIVLVSLLAGDAVRMCREFERAGLGGRVLRLSTVVDENAVLGVGHASSEGMFVAHGYFAALDSDHNGAFKERYRALFGDRAPALSSTAQSVYEGMVHLQRQACSGRRAARSAGLLPGVRDQRRGAYDAVRDPLFLGQVEGLGIRPLGRLTGERG